MFQTRIHKPIIFPATLNIYMLFVCRLIQHLTQGIFIIVKKSRNIKEN